MNENNDELLDDLDPTGSKRTKKPGQVRIQYGKLLVDSFFTPQQLAILVVGALLLAVIFTLWSSPEQLALLLPWSDLATRSVAVGVRGI